MASRREYWLRERQRIIDELREREPDLVRELEACDAAIEKLGDENPELQSDEYVRYSLNGWLAIVAFMEKRGRTADEESIIRAILDGGWQGGYKNKRAATNIKNSIGYQLRTSKENKILKKFPSGKIGLYGWSNDYDR